MKTLLAFTLILSGCSGFSGTSPGGDDLKWMEGTWNVKAGSPGTSGGQFIINGGRISRRTKDGLIEQWCEFSLDQKRRWLDLFRILPNGTVDKREEKKGMAIYELDGDTLKICVGPRGKRPDKMETQSREYQYLSLTRHK